MLLLTADTLPLARLVRGTQEGVLNFAPTYRMVKGKPEYSNKKNQNASWCDRVLVRSFPGYRSRVEQTLYTGLFDLTQVSWVGRGSRRGEGDAHRMTFVANGCVWLAPPNCRATTDQCWQATK